MNRSEKVPESKFEHTSHEEICWKLVARNAGAGRSDLIWRYVYDYMYTVPTLTYAAGGPRTSAPYV